MTDAPIVFMDTETTSLDPIRRRPWEIAMIRREPDGLTTDTLLQVSGVDLRDAEPMALQIGGFYQRYGLHRDGSNPAEYDGDFVTKPESVVFPAGDPTKWVREARAAWLVHKLCAGAVVVGANPQFDTVTLEPLLRRHGLAPSWHYRPVCIEAVAYGFLRAAAPDLEIQLPWKSDDLGRALHVEPAPAYERHTALGDARWVMRMWDRIQGND